MTTALWRCEAQNVVRNAERRGRIAEEATSRILRSLAALPLSVDPGIPLATKDAALRAATEQLGLVWKAAP